MRRAVTVLIAGIVAAALGWAQDAPADRAGGAPVFALSVSPEASMPMGENADLFSFGGGGSLAGHLQMGENGWFAPTLETAYSLAPTQADMTLSLLRAGAGIETSWRPDPRFAVHGFATGGGFYGMLEGSRTGDAFGYTYRAGAGLSYRITPTFGLSAGAAYTSYPGLYDGVSAFVGTRLTFGDDSGFEAGPQLRIRDPQFDTVFPVLFKYYDENPMGSVTIENTGDRPAQNVEVRVNVPQYMDTPDLSARISELTPGESQEIELTALFSDEVLSITEGTRVAATITADYEEATEPANTSATLSTYDRNALRWDDDKKVAAFVTARDEEIQSFARNVAAISRENRLDAVDGDLQHAMAQWAALVEHGASYVVDPSSAYEELSQNPFAVDFVQFPRQTLSFRAGDCDDLSATYAALLESIGIDTAFITIPGHIYMAFRLDMSPQEAHRAFTNAEDLIIREDESVWVPVETTQLEGTFREAWATGARQWRQHNPEGNAGFFTTAEAWSTYQPVAFSVSDIEIAQPDSNAVASAFRTELDRYVRQELAERQQRFTRRLEGNPDDHRIRNRLAVLYGRYGRYDQAREELQTILDQRPDYPPALINLGNVSFMAEEYQTARRHYERALQAAPENETALLGAARAANRLENYQEASDQYERLAATSPQLAERFSHLGTASQEGAARASEAAELARVVVWEEEE